MEHIWGPLIAAVASIGVALISWAISRQEKTDTRTRITQDLEILAKLKEGDTAHEKLKNDIDSRVLNMTEAANRKSRSQSLFQMYLLVAAFSLVIFVAHWLSNQEWVSGLWQDAVIVLLWIFALLTAMLLIGMVVTLGLWVRESQLEERTSQFLSGMRSAFISFMRGMKGSVGRWGEEKKNC